MILDTQGCVVLTEVESTKISNRHFEYLVRQILQAPMNRAQATMAISASPVSL